MLDEEKIKQNFEPSKEFRAKVMQRVQQSSMEEAPKSSLYLLAAAFAIVALPLVVFYLTTTPNQNSNYFFLAWHESVYGASYFEFFNLAK